MEKNIASRLFLICALVGVFATSNSCSIFQSKKSVPETSAESNKSKDKDDVVEKKAPMNDLVTVKTSLDLARAAYVRGCVQARRQLGVAKGLSFEKCTQMGKFYIEKEIKHFLINR